LEIHHGILAAVAVEGDGQPFAGRDHTTGPRTAINSSVEGDRNLR